MVNAVKMSDTCSLVLAQIPWRRYCSPIMYIIRSYSVTKCIPLFYCSVTAFQHLINCTTSALWPELMAVKYTTPKQGNIFPQEYFLTNLVLMLFLIQSLDYMWFEHTSSCITSRKTTDMCSAYLHCEIGSSLNPGFLPIFFLYFSFVLY